MCYKKQAIVVMSEAVEGIWPCLVWLVACRDTMDNKGCLNKEQASKGGNEKPFLYACSLMTKGYIFMCDI